MNNLYNFNASPACEYCVKGKLSPDDKMVLCVKQGIMMPSSSCSSFKYDPLKRKPDAKPQIFTDFSEEEFSL